MTYPTIAIICKDRKTFLESLKALVESHREGITLGDLDPVIRTARQKTA